MCDMETTTNPEAKMYDHLTLAELIELRSRIAPNSPARILLDREICKRQTNR